MSCRVLKRGMEAAMFEQLCLQAKRKQLKKIAGYYLPTAKNAMVKNLYGELGFIKIKETVTETVFEFDINNPAPAHHICCSS
jgi:predicted enzyme involved in methoxymalonyl-ACP biosynthesis